MNKEQVQFHARFLVRELNDLLSHNSKLANPTSITNEKLSVRAKDVQILLDIIYNKEGN